MTRRGFTVVEVVVSAAIGAVVIGTGMLMFLNGSKGFTKATQHASIREQALLILERIERDLEGLLVSQEKNPRTNAFFMVQPFELLNPRTDEATKRKWGDGVRFHVYHRMEMIRVKNPYDPETREEKVESESDLREEPVEGSLRLPRVVGRYIEYKSVAAADGKGFDLLRNNQRVNLVPLAEVRFERADPVHAVKTMGASPNAVLRIVVVPNHGMEGEMSEATIRKQDDVGTALSRVIHLVSYESQYTALLGVALERFKRKQELAPVELAVLRDAKVWGYLEDADKKLEQTPIRYRLPDDLVHIEVAQAYDTAARPDAEFTRAESAQGCTMAQALRRAGHTPKTPKTASALVLEGAP